MQHRLEAREGRLQSSMWEHSDDFVDNRLKREKISWEVSSVTVSVAVWQDVCSLLIMMPKMVMCSYECYLKMATGMTFTAV